MALLKQWGFTIHAGVEFTLTQEEHMKISDINSYGQLYPEIYRLIEFQEISYIIVRVLL